MKTALEENTCLETITRFLTEDHRYADNLFAAAGRHAAQREWQACAEKLAAFRSALESHMKLEEEALFPAFEEATGTDAGPTSVMRGEHREMLKTLDALQAAALAHEGERFTPLFESFLSFMEAHSMKEERILYPMCDRMVETLDAQDLRSRLAAIRASG